MVRFIHAYLKYKCWRCQRSNDIFIFCFQEDGERGRENEGGESPEPTQEGNEDRNEQQE